MHLETDVIFQRVFITLLGSHVGSERSPQPRPMNPSGMYTEVGSHFSASQRSSLSLHLGGACKAAHWPQGTQE